MVDITFVVTLRLGRVVTTARRQLLAVCRRRSGLRCRLVDLAAVSRAAISDAAIQEAII